MNNDRFKFRVWDKENECYQEKDADFCAIRHNGDLLCDFWGDGDTLSHQIVPEEDAIVEQCTGLRDKTGKLIYEGDIVNAKWGPNIIESAVIKHRRSGAFILEDGGRPIITVDDVHDIEIIGNIHEANGAHGTKGKRG